MVAHHRNPAFQIAAFRALGSVAVTAGAGDDGVATASGVEVDTLLASDQRYNALCAVVDVSAVLGDGETAVVELQWYSAAASGGSFAAVGSKVTGATLTGGSGGSTETQILKADVDLALSENRYWKLYRTVTCSAANTDVVTLAGIGFSLPEKRPA